MVAAPFKAKTINQFIIFNGDLKIHFLDRQNERDSSIHPCLSEYSTKLPPTSQLTLFCKKNHQLTSSLLFKLELCRAEIKANMNQKLKCKAKCTMLKIQLSVCL